MKIIVLLVYGFSGFMMLYTNMIILKPLFVEYPKFEELEFIKGRLTKVTNKLDNKTCKFPIDVEMDNGKDTIDVECGLMEPLKNELGGAIVIGIYLDKFDILTFLDAKKNRKIWYLELNGKVLHDYESQLKRSESKTFSLIYLTFLLIFIFILWKYRRQIKETMIMIQ